MGVDPASGLEARKLTLRERQLEGLRRSAALANEPCPEVVQIEDEKNAAEEAERQRIKQEEEERKRLLAGSSSSSSKMSRFTELKSMGEAEEQKVPESLCMCRDYGGLGVWFGVVCGRFGQDLVVRCCLQPFHRSNELLLWHQEVSDAVYATYIKRFDGLKSNVITSKVPKTPQ